MNKMEFLSLLTVLLFFALIGVAAVITRFIRRNRAVEKRVETLEKQVFPQALFRAHD